MKTKITLSSAIDGYLLYASARRLSPHTITDYQNTFRKLQAHLVDDPPLAAITTSQIREFLASQNGISKKTLLNYHTGLSALWTWSLAEGLVDDHILRHIDRPRPEQRAIQPLDRAAVEALLATCDHTTTYTRPGKRQCRNTRPTGLRDRAILLLLLDTGMRASELIELATDHADLKSRRVLVEGKGNKERVLPISARTAQALWRYLASRPDPRGNTTRLFVSDQGAPISRHALARMLKRLGRRAGIPDVHPHRLRHTFAIQFLRNGGNGYVLQSLLGHSTMEMVRVYLQLAQHDLADHHNRASPVDCWGL